MSLHLPKAQSPPHLPYLTWKVTVVIKEVRDPKRALSTSPGTKEVGFRFLKGQGTGVDTDDISKSGLIK